MRGTPGLMLLVTLVAPAASSAQSTPPPSVRPDPAVAEGVRLVGEGDYEGAIATLGEAAARLAADPVRAKEVSQACLYLGIAHVALDQLAQARDRFREALAREPALRLRPERFSPKVIRVFEEAREEVRRTAAASAGSSKRSGYRTPLLILGLGGAAAAGVVIARSASSDGSATVANARFATPVLDCPDGARGLVLRFVILADAVNNGSTALTVRSVTTTVIIRTSTIPSEVDFASSLESTFTPTSVPPGGRDTLRVESSLLCNNGEGDSPRFNEWLGRLTLATSMGVFTLETQDRLRVNIQ